MDLSESSESKSVSQGSETRPSAYNQVNYNDNTRKANDYAVKVGAVSKCITASSRYPGSNYERLASYLKPENRRVRKRPVDFKRPFAYTIRKVASSTTSQKERINDADNDQEPLNPCELDKDAKLIFLRGQPSSEWLKYLGGTYHIDPEFYQRHLDLHSTVGREDYYVLPSIPSASDSIIQLSYFTISREHVLTGMLNETRTSTGPETVDDLRHKAQQEMDSYTSRVTQDIYSDAGVGNSIVRSFHVFDNLRFALEQRMTLTVTTSGDGEHWAAIVWIDTGKDLGHGPSGPWSPGLDGCRNKQSVPPAFLPTIQVRPFVARLRSSNALKSDHEAQYAQSSALVHINYGESLDQRLITRDAFYLFQELFEFSAFSTVQFLNLIDNVLSNDSSSIRNRESKQANFIYIQDILEHQEERLQENIQVIKSRGMGWWDQTENEQQRKSCQQTANSLQHDYDAILLRTTKLKDKCQSQINNLVTQAMLEESRKAMIQAAEVTKLTRMAFFFIPLSFTCSLFGMNVSPIVSGAPPMWVWGAVTIPTVFFSLVFLRWSPLEMRSAWSQRKREKLKLLSASSKVT